MENKSTASSEKKTHSIKNVRSNKMSANVEPNQQIDSKVIQNFKKEHVPAKRPNFGANSFQNAYRKSQYRQTHDPAFTVPSNGEISFSQKGVKVAKPIEIISKPKKSLNKKTPVDSSNRKGYVSVLLHYLEGEDIRLKSGNYCLIEEKIGKKFKNFAGPFPSITAAVDALSIYQKLLPAKKFRIVMHAR